MVKNESKHLEKCLQSLVPILTELKAELIIVDTGSTDNTVDIAKRYTDKVFHHEWFDDFAGMRNIVLSYCSGEWFFYVDGDEIVEDASGIVRFFKSGQHRKYNAAFIDMKNPYSSREIDGYGLFQALRFFRKDKDFHFKGIVHEQPQAKGPVARVEGSIIHYGYISDDPELMEYKFQRNVALIKKVLSEEPDNIYHLYQLSQSYGMYNKHRDALEPIEKAYRLAKKKGLAQYMNVVTQMASVYYQNKMFKQCEAICQEGLGIKSGYMDLYYYQAMSQAELGKLRESIPLFRKYLSLVNQYESGQGMIDFTIAHHTVRYKERAFAMLCGIYAKLGDYEKAEEYGTMVTAPELAKHVVPHLVDAYFNQDDYNAIRKLYNKWQHDEGILSTIERAIENKLLVATSQEKQEIARLFADMGNTYGLLNAARYHYLDGRDQVTLDFWRKIAEIDLNRKEVYYGDLILFYMNKGRSLVELLKNVRNENIMAYFSYLFGAYEQLTKEFRTLFNNKTLWETAEGDTQVYRIKTAIIYAFLRQNGVSDNDYEVFFRIYTDVGIKYLEECYNQKILDADSTSWAITSADEFLFLIRKALVFDRNRVEYVQLLRRALVSDPSMKKGIEILINEFSAKLETPEDMEFNRLKKSVQESIQNAINNSQLDVAASLIKEYEDIVGVDASLCAFKGIMHMINGNYEAARDNFLLGLKLEPDNEDLIYNLNYLDDIGQAK
jgi:glycosyltransferase involved in cell wall biosynthesis